MTNQPEFTLHRLYHRPGGVTEQAAPVGEMVAATQGLTRVHWDEARRMAPLPNPLPGQYAQGALGIFRGQTVDFILAHAHVDSGGLPVVQYVFLPTELLRAVAGRFKLMLPLTDVHRPFDPSRPKLFPHKFLAPEPPTVEEQTDDLLNFMLLVNDDFDVIEGLLSALVQGIPLGILRAPGELETQLTFLQGLLSMLPVPARFGVTFTTHQRRPEPVLTQIAFLTTETTPPGYLAYDWQRGQLSGDLPEDPYSRYIVQQLRLDAGVAINQMVALTRIAAWRLSRGDSLADSLGWSAKRMALDAAVRDNQPADSGMVAAVLREDPTLSDDLRLRYVRHLLAFSLALNRIEAADVIAILANSNDAVASQVQSMFDEAIDEGQAAVVYHLIARWLADPLGPDGYAWRQRAHRAALAHLRALVAAQDATGVYEFMRLLQNAPPALMMTEIAPEMLDVVMPLADKSPQLAGAVFLLAVNYLPAAPFQRLLRMNNFVAQMPQRLQSALAHFQPGPPSAATRGMLAQVAAEFGRESEALVLARLVEWAVAVPRVDLVDTAALEKLAGLLHSSLRDRFAPMLGHLVKACREPKTLALLDPEGARYLVEILLFLEEYDSVPLLCERISNAIFPGEKQLNFAPWMSDVFEKTAVGPDKMLKAMDALARRGMRPVPRLMAYRGALLNTGFDAKLAPVSEQLTSALISDPRLVTLVGFRVSLELLRYHAQRQDLPSAANLGASIADSAAASDDGLKIVGQLWGVLNWNNDARRAALDLLRRFTRQVPVKQAVRIPGQVGRRLGQRVQEMVQATVTLSILTGGADLKTFAVQVHDALDLLRSIGGPYVRSPYPSLKQLRSDMDALTGNLSADERHQLSADMLEIGRAIFQLGQLYGSGGRGRGRPNEQEYIRGRAAPHNAAEMLLWIGGYFAEHEDHSPDFNRWRSQHVLEARSLTMVRDEAGGACDLLNRLLAAFPADNAPILTRDALAAELSSLWSVLSQHEQKEVRDFLAKETQILAMLLLHIAQNGDVRALDDTGLGRNLETAKREPKSGLEALRLLSGYFAQKFTV